MIKPYYQTELGKLYHGDCLEIMPELEPVALVLTDPPYGIGIAKYGTVGGSKPFGKTNGKIIEAKQYPKTEWDKKRPPEIFFEYLIKKSKHQIIWGGNYFADLFKPSPCWLVWHKDNTGNFADCELAWTSFTTATRLIKWRWNGFLQEVGGKDREIRYHPTQKPVGLFIWVLDRYSKPKNIILDPMIGSGTTAVACERLNRRWIGIEIEERYCEIAAKRIEKERSQLKLWN